MKIESSAVQMGSVHSVRQRVRTETTLTDTLLADTGSAGSSPDQSADSAGQTLTAGHGFFMGAMWSSRAHIRSYSSGQRSASLPETLGELRQRLMKHIIRMMRDMFSGVNIRTYSNSADYLTSDSDFFPLSRIQLWRREETVTTEYSEKEFTTFDTDGVVKTSDGRELSFSLSFSMSRSFMEQTSFSRFEETAIIATIDPLVINMDIPTAALSDQKFFFDLDCDGEREELSSLGIGSGFLALDKNGDGIISDGSELFGTESGDGFRDLAQYDEDGNGWIDENDAVFQRLKVWTKDENGMDLLLPLTEADVGAIFLGHVATQFSLNDEETNDTDAFIRSSGFYLHESTGEAGTVQHVDFAVS